MNRGTGSMTDAADANGSAHLSPHPDAAVDFLENLRPGGPWVLTAYTADGRITTATVTTEDAAAAFIRRHGPTRNLYYSVNPLRRPMDKKAAKTDIAAVEFL